MITDQRYHPRVSFFMGGDIYKNQGGEKIGHTVIRDLSLSGMRVETLECLEVTQTVYVDFSVAGKFAFQRVPARVTRIYRNVGSYMAGLTFIDGHFKRKIHQALNFVLEDGV
jgi:hypothetical protein